MTQTLGVRDLINAGEAEASVHISSSYFPYAHGGYYAEPQFKRPKRYLAR